MSVLSALAVASVCPSGEKAISRISPVWDLRDFRRLPVFTSQRCAVKSQPPPVARSLPSGEKQIRLMEPKSLSGACRNSPVVISQIRKVPPALARVLLSGEKARALTASGCPVRLRIYLPVLISHKRTVQVPSAVASFLRSGEKASAVIESGYSSNIASALPVAVSET